MKKLLAFNGDSKLKTELLKEVESHRKADQIMKGTYGKEIDGKWRGCAVGCAIHSLNKRLGKNYDTQRHSVYEKELGIPEAIAYLKACIFEGLPKEKAMQWPERFFEAIAPNADLALVIPEFMVWLMEGLQKYAVDNPSVSKALDGVKDLYQRIVDGGAVSDAEWDEAARAAAGAAAEAAGAAAKAAGAAAEAARAVWAAVWAARAVWAAAWAVTYEKMADKLINLLESAEAVRPVDSGVTSLSAVLI